MHEILLNWTIGVCHESDICVIHLANVSNFVTLIMLTLLNYTYKLLPNTKISHPTQEKRLLEKEEDDAPLVIKKERKWERILAIFLIE